MKRKNFPVNDSPKRCKHSASRFAANKNATEREALLLFCEYGADAGRFRLFSCVNP